MTIEITQPELEAREAWLAGNKDLIAAKIEQGLAQLDRGEGIPGTELRKVLEAGRALWLADRADS